jgi:cytochrome P450
MHRRPDLYGMDAEIFRPERWDEELPMQQDGTKRAWGYLPFHGGARGCIGSELALFKFPSLWEKSSDGESC